MLTSHSEFDYLTQQSKMKANYFIEHSPQINLWTKILPLMNINHNGYTENKFQNIQNILYLEKN